MELTKAILLSAFSIVFGGLVGFWLGIVRERIKGIENRIIEEKLQLIPMLDNSINRAKIAPGPISIQRECVRQIHPNYQRLKVLLKRKRLKNLNDTWEALNGMTVRELAGSSNTGVFNVNVSEQKRELENIQQILISRLEAIKKAVERL